MIERIPGCGREANGSESALADTPCQSLSISFSAFAVPGRVPSDPNSSRVTIRDVARHAGVSVATVSKVINDRYGVSADTTAHVKAMIKELGYEASLVARSLRNHRTNVIADPGGRP